MRAHLATHDKMKKPLPPDQKPEEVTQQLVAEEQPTTYTEEETTIQVQLVDNEMMQQQHEVIEVLDGDPNTQVFIY